MTPQIPWLRVFVEGVVIVASIRLAFGIVAWWAGLEQRVTLVSVFKTSLRTGSIPSRG